MTKNLAVRYIAMFCFVLCLITIGGLFSQTDRGMKTIKIRTEAGKEIELYKDSYALVVGNGNYTNGWDPLDGALKDVKEVETVLKKHGFHVTLKTNLTKAEFDSVFAKFVLRSGKDAENRLLFYYAGHGYTRESAAGEDLGYLVMVDAPAPSIDEVGFELESVDMKSLVTQAEKILARHALFVFDSCFSGTVLNARDQLNRPESISDSVRYPVRQFITAGRAGEIVPDHSDFKQAFLDLLEGRAREPFPDGYITGEELGFYLKNQVPVYNSAQHPQYGKIRNPKLDKGDFVFVLPKAEAWTPSPTDLSTVATLTVTSTPSGATVYVDGLQIGKTPLQGYQIDTGVRRVKQVKVGLSLSGYNNRTTHLTLKGGQEEVWHAGHLEKLVSRTTTLTVTSTPNGATVYIDGVQVGKTPLTGYQVDTGIRREKQVEVGLELSGYKSRVAKLTLKGGKKTQWEVRLEKVQQIQKATVPSGPSTEGMVLIPAGEFQMGSNDSDASDNQKPVHTVYVDAFYMDKYEVTNAQYKKFVDANPQWRKDRIPRNYNGRYLMHWNENSYPHGKGNHPVVYVSWYAAMAYAEWAGKRLPTEAEWEKAARGGLVGKKYPWGDSIDSSRANYGGNVGDTTSVGSYPPNGYGLYDMAGNVWEWCLDGYQEDFYAYSPYRNPIGGYNSIAVVINNFTRVKSGRMARSGDWRADPKYLCVATRFGGGPTFLLNFIGFRCARAQ